MVIKKEISIDSIVAALSVLGAAAVLYARLCVVETKVDGSKADIANNSVRIIKIEAKIEDHEKALVELKTLVKVKGLLASPKEEN